MWPGPLLSEDGLNVENGIKISARNPWTFFFLLQLLDWFLVPLDTVGFFKGRCVSFLFSWFSSLTGLVLIGLLLTVFIYRFNGLLYKFCLVCLKEFKVRHSLCIIIIIIITLIIIMTSYMSLLSITNRRGTYFECLHNKYFKRSLGKDKIRRLVKCLKSLFHYFLFTLKNTCSVWQTNFSKKWNQDETTYRNRTRLSAKKINKYMVLITNEYPN